jgi:hypothetical protein
VLGLAGCAMAELAVERLPPTELILHFSAMAVGFVLDVKVLHVLVDAVRRALLPLGDARRRLAAALVLVHPEGRLCKCGMLARELRC